MKDLSPPPVSINDQRTMDIEQLANGRLTERYIHTHTHTHTCDKTVKQDCSSTHCIKYNIIAYTSYSIANGKNIVSIIYPRPLLEPKYYNFTSKYCDLVHIMQCSCLRSLFISILYSQRHLDLYDHYNIDQYRKLGIVVVECCILVAMEKCN